MGLKMDVLFSAAVGLLGLRHAIGCGNQCQKVRLLHSHESAQALCAVTVYARVTQQGTLGSS